VEKVMNRVGFGTFPLAGVFTPVDKPASIAIIQQFLELGGYYIDTAPMYGFGEVEKLLGEALSSNKREEYYLITKCGYIDVEGKTFGTLQKGATYEDVIRECENSLKRLKTDYIDLYFIHSPNKNTPFEETMRAMEELKKSGKIREIGVSNVNLAELKEYNKNGSVKFVQNKFSVINRSIDKELEAYMTENGIKLIPYHVLEIGLLTGSAFEGIENLREGDFRRAVKYWDYDRIAPIINWVKEELDPIAKEIDCTIGQLAIAWALAKPFVGSVIVGTTNQKYLSVNMKANDIVLSPEILTKIDSAYQKLEDNIKLQSGLSIREFRGLNEKYY
jgi:myo-inositol catabolism protein IolS